MKRDIIDKTELKGLILNNQTAQNTQMTEEDKFKQKINFNSNLNKNPSKNHITPFEGFAAMINVILATGPFTMPKPFNEAGVILGTIFILWVLFWAYMSAEFILESMSIANAILHMQRTQEQNNNQSNEASILSIRDDQSDYQLSIAREQQDRTDLSNRQSQININENQQPNNSNNNQSNNQNNIIQQSNRNSINPFFRIKQTTEFGQMSELFFGYKGKLVLNICISTYLYGALSIKCVTAAQSLVFGLSFFINPSYFSNLNGNHHLYFDPYFVCVTAFFIFGAFLALKDMQNIKTVQIIVCALRFFTIFLLLFGAFYYIYQRQRIADLNKINYVNYNSFAEIYGNSVFAFLMHHSIPVICSPIKPEPMIKKTIFSSFFVAFLILFSIVITSVLAFGDLKQSCEISYPCKVQVLYSENFWDIPFLGQFVNFYLIFNLAAFPILAIALRNNLISIFQPEKLEEINNTEQSQFNSRLKIFYTFLALFPVFLISLILKNDLTYLLEISGGVCGVILMLLIPSALVLKGRQLKLEIFGDIQKKTGHESIFSQQIWPILMFVLGIIFLSYTLYLQIF